MLITVHIHLNSQFILVILTITTFTIRCSFTVPLQAQSSFPQIIHVIDCWYTWPGVLHSLTLWLFLCGFRVLIGSHFQSRLEVGRYGAVCDTNTLWNHPATSFLRNTILVRRRDNTDHNAYLIIWQLLERTISRAAWFATRNAAESVVGLRLDLYWETHNTPQT